MAVFTTRVELLNADSDDYEALHIEMARRNFTRTIKSDNGVEFHLPPAEYNREGEYTSALTLSAAMAAASATGKDHRVLVTESEGRRWYNLEPVK